MWFYSKDRFGKDWKVTIDTFSFQATKTKMVLKIEKTIIEERIFDISQKEAEAMPDFFKLNEKELQEKAVKILNSYRFFYYIIRYNSFGITFLKKLLNKYYAFYE